MTLTYNTKDQWMSLTPQVLLRSWGAEYTVLSFSGKNWTQDFFHSFIHSITHSFILLVVSVREMTIQIWTSWGWGAWESLWSHNLVEYIFVQITKIYFSYTVGLHQLFLARSSPNPCNFLIVDNKDVFCYVNDVTFRSRPRVGAGSQENQPWE